MDRPELAAQRQNEALLYKTQGLDRCGVSQSHKVAFAPHFWQQDFDAVCNGPMDTARR